MLCKKYQLDLIIIACNNASAVLLPILRAKLSCFIISTVPAIKLAVKLTKNGIIGLLATKATIQYDYTQKLIKIAADYKIMKFVLSKSVSLAEVKRHGRTTSTLTLCGLLYNPLLSTIESPDIIVYGYTHLPLLNRELKLTISADINLIDSSTAIVKQAIFFNKNTKKIIYNFKDI